MSSRADRFEPVGTEEAARWRKFAAPGETIFPSLLGFVVEDVRHGYCRMRLPLRPELMQAAGIVHGGALASLLDSVMVPAIGATLPPKTWFSTIDLHVQYVDALADDDVVAEGWIVRQGKRTVFGESEARAATSGDLVAKAMSTFTVRPPAA